MHRPIEIVALHGMFGRPSFWDPSETFLRKTCKRPHRWQKLDLWASSWDLAFENVGQTLNALTPGPRVLLGYSMGARLALHALIREPWDLAILIGPNFGLESEAKRSERRKHDARWAERLATLPAESFSEEWNAQTVFEGGRPVPLKTSPAMVRGFTRWSLGNQVLTQENLRSIASRLILVVGERDAKFRSIARAALPLLSNATLNIVPGAGHRVPMDAPKEFGSLLAKAVNEL